MNRFLVCLLIVFSLSLSARSQSVELKGLVWDESGLPLPGAFVRLLDTEYTAICDETGSFSLDVPVGRYRMSVSYIGMETHEQELEIPVAEPLEIRLLAQSIDLSAVDVVSTGYQQIPKERATGSFAHLDRELVQRRVGANVLDRLEDVTSGLLFNHGPQAANDPITIRGRSTIFSDTQPLIIVDNFPYDGPMENINPNDVASITVLKDAAASSIWGARAGNGVIVITTYRGSEDQAMQVSLNSNLTATEARDLFYMPQMSIPDFIGIEQQLFANNFYRALENNANKPKLSPVVETLIAQRDGKITSVEAEARLQQYRASDIRSDLEDHYLQSSISQQYALSLRGGGKRHGYHLSLGYDQSAADLRDNGKSRWTLAGGNQWSLLRDKLEAGIDLNFARQRSDTRTVLPNGYAYESLTDASGNPAWVTHTYSTRYIESVEGKGLLDWRYFPLDEIGRLDSRNEAHDFRISPSLRWNITPDLDLGVYYQYWSNLASGRDRNSQELFYTRDLINKYSQTEDDGNLSYPVPLGDVLNVSENKSHSHTFRPQLTYSKDMGGIHFLNVLAGAEVRDRQGLGYTDRFYGYRDDMGSSVLVDWVSRFPMYYNPGSQVSILSAQSHSGTTDRFVSYYGNVGYDYRHRYFLTLSARKDQSNIFGVEANKRGVPLWSMGGAWILSEESFLDGARMPFLKLRATYGYSGNVDKSLSSDVTARYVNFLFYDVLPQMRAAVLVNPPNPDLRWEKIRMANLALDWETESGFFAGSLEYYDKQSSDLLGEYSVPASSGQMSFTGNFAETQTRGVDLNMNVRWFRKSIQWSTNLLFSQLREKVKDFEKLPTVANLLGTAFSAAPQPIVGRPLYGIYTYEWAGLSPDKGNPMGYLDGEASEDYLAISRAATIDNLQYHGPARPTVFGALRNDLSYRGFSLSVNVSYRFGYYYKRRSIDYFTLLRGEIGHGDFDRRWKQPGDEEFTQIPSLPPTADSRRNAFYANSGILVEKGDHIRLNDVRLAYTFSQDRQSWLPFRSAQLYAYAHNLGIIWKASDDALDPDYQTSKPLTSASFGVQLDF
ncbi:SusC/RagA family TonB-linked outer membrane protein [Algoriphagus sp. H41]|uniref:SusC/RagA family TonB-linked outer membrane protein n=1 Tax=Algoriphagus oliviformis TaxID=2811231 RepID=A0ABS3C8K1_9BACT|nr:SusC/RagA family TonB-linked outer membrane protein [Algoriphagus oliviformis]MBN7813433.1 SusC/RagA family TonB-linked outer membrane protein [Algoriphagus oliviformis]